MNDSPENSFMILYLAIYSLFFSFLWLSKEKRVNRLFDNDGFTKDPALLIAFHLVGILILGFAPLLSGHESSYLGQQETTMPMMAVTVILSCICIFISYLLATKKFNQLTDKGLILVPVNTTLITGYLLVRIVFIVCYEIWFRRLLLDYGIDNFGLVPAILFNVGFYALLHIVNGKQEMICCIPFGLLLCLISVWQGSALPAIVIHLALTITYEFSFYRKTKIFQSVVI